MSISTDLIVLRRITILARTGRLRELREVNGWTQADVARELEVAESQVSRWEAGTQRPTIDHARGLLDLFDDEGAT
jgi:transcriptional regulator with XRE-family HTH domain